ncbi:MAG: hypothetical protein ABJG41_07235 [Cyclobacteriaceae bacterium]
MKKLIAILIIPTILIVACTDNQDPEPGTQPLLPPGSSMAPDLSAFTEDEDDGGRMAAAENWAYAAINVGVYSTILGINLVVPVTAYKAAIDQTPSFDTDAGVWVWAYSTDIPSKGSFEIKLTADVKVTGVEWTGYISKAGEFEDYVWFTGSSSLDAKSGSWTLYEGPGSSEAWLSSEWTKDDTSDTATSTFTVEKDGAAKGSYITYAISSDTEFDRNVIISDVNAEKQIFIDWSSTNFSGRVKSETYFQDSFYHCWDQTLSNTEC